MKRRYAVVYLLFLLCLFLFPPWSIGPRSLQNAADSIAGSCRGLDHQYWDPYPIPASCGDLGHHWRFAVPKFQQTLTANDDLYWTLPSALSEWQVTEAEVPKTRESLEQYSTESLATDYPKSPAGSPDYDAVVHTRNMVYESLIALILVALAALLERPILALAKKRAQSSR
jgi:hypothetical protein